MKLILYFLFPCILKDIYNFSIYFTEKDVSVLREKLTFVTIENN